MKSDRRKIGKTKVRVKNIANAVLKNECSIINPIFVLKNAQVIDSSRPNILKCNYLYSSDFKKYYFVENITCREGGIYEFNCSVDVLETYKNNILQLTTLVERQENKFSPYIPDSELKITSANSSTGKARVLDKYSIGNLGNSFSYVITVNGGGNNVV